MKQRSLRRWMVVNDSDMYYCEAEIGYPFWWFTKDWTDAYFFEEKRDMGSLMSRLKRSYEFYNTLKAVRVRAILQHLEEY